MVNYIKGKFSEDNSLAVYKCNKKLSYNYYLPLRPILMVNSLYVHVQVHIH